MLFGFKSHTSAPSVGTWCYLAAIVCGLIAFLLFAALTSSGLMHATQESVRAPAWLVILVGLAAAAGTYLLTLSAMCAADGNLLRAKPAFRSFLLWVAFTIAGAALSALLPKDPDTHGILASLTVTSAASLVGFLISLPALPARFSNRTDQSLS